MYDDILKANSIQELEDIIGDYMSQNIPWKELFKQSFLDKDFESYVKHSIYNNKIENWHNSLYDQNICPSNRIAMCDISITCIAINCLSRVNKSTTKEIVNWLTEISKRYK